MICTERLILRKWIDKDLEPFAAINQDPKVMEFFPGQLTREETLVLITRFNAHIEQHGFGLYACEERHSRQFIGFVGLNIPNFKAHFTPCVEVGARLAVKFWGIDYALEAARKMIAVGFEQFALSEIVGFTTVNNKRSRGLMEKIGMQRDPNDDFYHPNINIDHPLGLHVLYRLRNEKFTNS
ncbi:MAG: GNAT family N-acetyltransferase [Gammaproteobacteria bacterium RIFCSPHIGHO2_12_FULL_35_23]|nr:MAG: GNAT family N-acetyltransferase [Gammaproteobacteria bacterium RIFCSPHIGHO2_12_FULL_35_23]